MRRFAIEAIIFGVLLASILYAPSIAAAAIFVLVPVAAVASGIGIIYLRHVYKRQRRPRSRFFGMLIEVDVRTWLATAWVGYLIIGRLSERAAAELNLPAAFHVPVPTPEVSAPITGLAFLVAVSPPIFHAVEVWRVRRGTGNASIDREDDE